MAMREKRHGLKMGLLKKMPFRMGFIDAAALKAGLDRDGGPVTENPAVMTERPGAEMKAQATDIPGVLLIEPLVHKDERGVFFETYNERAFEQATGLRPHFVQDNHSVSVPNAVRGLHYQVGMGQGKLVRVVRGAVFDVVVDMRRASPTFGQAMTIVLSAGNRRQLWIPPGFAHGFLALGEGAECVYKISGYWSPAHERVLLWNDPALAIAWPLSGEPILSEKDRTGTLLRDAETCDFF